MFNYLGSEKGLPVGNFPKTFRIPQPVNPPVVILPNQLHFLITNTIFENRLTKALQRTKDIVMFGCTVGLRFADLMNLKVTQTHFLDNICYLTVNTSKTGTVVQMPLPIYCEQILAKYKGKQGKYLIPRLANSNFNLQIKRIGELAGWVEVVPKFLSKRGKRIEQKDSNNNSWKFYQHLSAHSMRRTAITTLLLLGEDEAVVRRLSGHAPGSKEFYRYIAFTQAFLDKQVKKAHALLIENPNIYAQL